MGPQGSLQESKNKKENKNNETYFWRQEENNKMSIALYPYNGRVDEAPVP